MSSQMMKDFPPRSDQQVSLANWRMPPFSKWAFVHVRELVPSADIANEPDAVIDLERRPVDLRDVVVETDEGGLDLDGYLEATDTDGLVVLHKGALAFEHYRHDIAAHEPHILMSVSKSVLGLIVGILESQGVLAVDQFITDIVPELAETAYAGATVRDLLDMRVGVYFLEDYTAADGLIIEYRKAQNWNPLEPGEAPSDLRSFFGRMTRADGRHGEKFHYVSPNTDLLGWVLERAAGKRYADIVSDVLWKPMGAERSAYVTVDRLGAPRCAGGLCCTPRDLARIGQLFVTRGKVADRQVVPAAWIDDTLQHGDPEAWDAGDLTQYFPDLPIHYRNKWYVLRGERPMVFGLGIFGQNVFVDPARELVIAKCSSQPVALDTPRIRLTLQGVEAMRRRFA